MFGSNSTGLLVVLKKTDISLDENWGIIKKITCGSIELDLFSKV